MGKYTVDSTTVKPTTDVTVDSILDEADTEDRYRFNRYNRWELIPPVRLKAKRIPSLLIPTRDSHIFGDNQNWAGVNIELHSNGCMVYTIRSSATVAETRGSLRLNDVAITTLLPKIQTYFKFDNTTSASAATIGLIDDSKDGPSNTTTFIANDIAIVAFGYRKTDTNFFLFHNDTTGAVNAINTNIARDTSIHLLEIEYETSTSVRVTLFDVNGTVQYNTVLSSQIPATGIDLGVDLNVINADTVAQYGIRIYDYIRIEKNKPTPDPTLDF